MKNNQEDAVRRISEVFLEKYLEEYTQIPKEMDVYKDRECREIMAELNPVYARYVEAHTLDELRKGLENLALAKAVAHAIVYACNLLK